MEITQLTFQLLLLFFPGIVAYLLIEQLTTKRRTEPFRFTIYAFVLGLLSYAAYGLILELCTDRADVQFFNSMRQAQTLDVNVVEIAWVTVCAVILGGMFVAIETRKWLHKLAKKLKISNVFGDTDVWDYVIGLEDGPLWATIRDHANDLMYQWKIAAYSEAHAENELLLSDVKVFRNSDAFLLYDVPMLYLTRADDSLNVELYYGIKGSSEPGT